MRILVLSDTHGNLSRLDAVLRGAGTPDAIIHLGDHASDAAKIAKRTGIPVLSVRGNCDYDDDVPSEAVFSFEDVRLFCTHGHLYWDETALRYRAEELGRQAVLHGHTHIPALDYDGTVLDLNPGSLSLPRGGSKPGYAMLLIEGKTVKGTLYAL